ncbi:hypothetical protein GCM10023170_083570 [Phytohabitans houttuyneae]|uniref:Uncharacterized protein n=1 Tax=Phytohabitans houttuyneae TaxID=1076126 RepID=A0A6V8KE26_9ACTN|nr:hypothetical protein Phou_076630 [Phytohabitans houttuyneae]
MPARARRVTTVAACLPLAAPVQSDSAELSSVIGAVTQDLALAAYRVRLLATHSGRPVWDGVTYGVR